MVILVDIGNSNIVLARHTGDIKQTYRYTTDIEKSVDEYYRMLQYIIQDAEMMIISSVVPELNIIFKNLCSKYLNFEPMFIGPGVKTGIKILVDNPKEVGSDLVADAAAAIHYYGEHVIVFDMGTATTVTYIEQKTIKGVAIMSGLVTQRNALIGNTSQLSQFEFRTPKNILATNTIDCLNAGFLYSHVFTINGFVSSIKAKYNTDPKVVITGGASRFIKELCKEKNWIFDDHLLLKGLEVIYQKNK